jgi:hypothetical protein
MSFAILPNSIAKFFNADDTFATGNLLCNAYCISFCGLSDNFDILLNSTITVFLYPLGVFAPVPTAVPPNATRSNSF